MFNAFKRRSPAHRARTRPATEPVRITKEDAIIAAHHGLTPEQWADLSPLAREDHREHVAWATRQAS